MAEQTDEVLTQREAADFLKLSGRTLERMRQAGGGPKYCSIGARVVYRRADLQSWLASKVVGSTSASTVRNRAAA